MDLALLKLMTKNSKSVTAVGTVVVTILLIIITSSFYQTLEFSDGWERGALGYKRGGLLSGFISERQLFANSRLNVNVWHGFNSIVLKTPFPLKDYDILFDSTVGNGSYFYVFLTEKTGYSIGLRISRNNTYPPIFFVSDLEGKFIVKKNIDYKFSEESKIRIKLTKSEVLLYSNNELYGVITVPEKFLKDNVRFSFKGGPDEIGDVYIDNFKISKKNILVFDDNFSSVHSWKSLSIGFLLLSFFLLVFYFVSISSTLYFGGLIIFLTIGFYIDHDFIAPRYFDLTNVFINFHERHKEIIAKDLDTILAEEGINKRHKSKKMVCFIGGSKTLGVGANRESDTWFKQVERYMNSDKSLASKYSMKNLGVAASSSQNMKDYYQKIIKSLQPQIVVFLVGINDHNKDEQLSTNISSFTKYNDNNGIRTILIPELMHYNIIYNTIPYSVEVLRSIANKYDSVDSWSFVSEFMKSETYDSGLLWSDWIHFSSYGQSVFAQNLWNRLQPELLINR